MEKLIQRQLLLGRVTLGLLEGIKKFPHELFNTNLIDSNFISVGHLRICRQVLKGEIFNPSSRTATPIIAEAGGVFTIAPDGIFHLYHCNEGEYTPLIHAYAQIHDLKMDQAVLHADDALKKLNKKYADRSQLTQHGSYRKIKPNSNWKFSHYNSPIVQSGEAIFLDYQNQQFFLNCTAPVFQLATQVESTVISTSYIQTNKALEFRDKYGRLCNLANQLSYGKNTFYVPAGHFQSDHGQLLTIPHSFSEGSPIYNADKIHANPNAPITFVANLTEIASSSSPIYSSFLGDLNNADLEVLKGRDVTYDCKEINEHSFQMACTLNEKLYDHAQLKFRYKLFSGLGKVSDYRNPSSRKVINDPWTLSREDFFNKFKEHGFKLPDAKEEEISIEPTVAELRLKKVKKMKKEIITGFAKSGKIYVIAGSPKVGKSLLSSRIAQQLSTGGELWGHKITKSKVLYFDTEMDDDDYEDRNIEENENFHIILEQHFSVHGTEDVMEKLKRYLTYLKKFVIEGKYEVLFVDCLYRLIDESNPSQMIMLVNFFKDLKKLDVLVFIVHHVNKQKLDKNDPFKSLAGHSTLARTIDGGIMLLWNDDKTSSIVKIAGKEKKIIDVKFMSRGYEKIEDKQVYLDKDLKHVAIEKVAEIKVLNKEETLLMVLKRHVPKILKKAMTKDMLTPLLVDDSDFNLKESTLKNKYTEWVKKGWLLADDSDNAHKYYLAPKHH